MKYARNLTSTLKPKPQMPNPKCCLPSKHKEKISETNTLKTPKPTPLRHLKDKHL